MTGGTIRHLMTISVALAFSAAAQATGASLMQLVETDCRVGTYRLADGSDVDIAPSEASHLRWRRKDGTTGSLTPNPRGEWTSTLGWTAIRDGNNVRFNCGTRMIDFAGVSGKRLDFDVTETRFRGAGAELAGRLVLPKGAGEVPIVVLVHGSEQDSARKYYALQRLFPSVGIGAFVYDKRGTGESGGQYTQDFLTLSDDAVAAAREARRLAAGRAGRVGYQAGSEGGWVAPLAARIERVDFMIVGFGLAVSPLEEDREAIALDISRRGYGPDVMAKAMEVADATAQVLVSGFREGFDQVEAVKRKYGSEPWFSWVHGDVSFAVLGKPATELRELGPRLLPNTPFYYDPMPVLENLDTPQLWLLGADDLEAPSAETARRLRSLAARGRPITTIVFPHTEHGIYNYVEAADGTRTSTRQPSAYFTLMRDFILNRPARARPSGADRRGR
jgi:hypothetical protein